MIRIIILTVICFFSVPLTLLAKSDNSSSEAGLFYSTWGSGVMGGYYYTNEILLGGDFAAGDTSLKVKDLEHQLNLNQLSRLLMHLDVIT